MAITWRNDPERTPTSKDRSRARVLRHRATDAERKLWWHLRHRMPADGTHFRRQVAIGPYVADFCCLKAKLIIEVDGNQHGLDANIASDAKRSAYLTSQGFSALRFSNREVMTEINGVLEAIYASLSTPTPNPSPASGRSRPSSTGYGGGEQSGARS